MTRIAHLSFSSTKKISQKPLLFLLSIVIIFIKNNSHQNFQILEKILQNFIIYFELLKCQTLIRCRPLMHIDTLSQILRNQKFQNKSFQYFSHVLLTYFWNVLVNHFGKKQNKNFLWWRKNRYLLFLLMGFILFMYGVKQF